MLILVLPAFVPDGPQARIVPLALEVEPLVIEVDHAAWYEWALLDVLCPARPCQIAAGRALAPVLSIRHNNPYYFIPFATARQ